MQIAILQLAVASVLGQCPETWKPGDGVPGVTGPYGGSVSALTVWDPDGPGPAAEKLVVAGDIDLAGRALVRGLAAWNGSDWEAVGTGVSGGFASIGALQTYEGALVAGGSFTEAGGAPANNIARWDGVSWQPLGSGVDGSVGSMAVYGGDLIAAGSFLAAGGIPANRIARWDGASWHALGAGLNEWVAGLTEFEGELVAFGSFTGAGGAPANRIARWNGLTWRPFAPDADLGWINAAGLYQGALVISGWRTYQNAEIQRWTGFGWELIGAVYHSYYDWLRILTLKEVDGYLVAGGNFTSINGVPIEGAARWNGGEWQSLNLREDPFVNSLAVYQGDLIIAGAMVASGALNIARLDGDAWHPLGSGFEAPIVSILPYRGGLIAAGSFTHAGTVVAHKLACWDGGRWSPLGGGVGESYWSDYVNCLAVFHDELVAGGRFGAAGDAQVNHIARWDGASWHSLGDGVANDASYVWIHAMAVYGDDLIAGGVFSSAGGVLANGIAAWDGISWRPLGEGVAGRAGHGSVEALTVFDGELIVGGDFDSAGGVAMSKIAAWNGEAWRPLGTGLGGLAYPAVQALCVFESELIAGGRFSNAGGIAVNRIAAWNGTSWRPLGGGLCTGSGECAVLALEVHDGELIAGGVFTTADQLPAERIARWDGNSWSPLASGMPGASWVAALATFRGELLAGGGFLQAGGEVSVNFARWGPAPSPCDVNCDASINGFDVQPFVEALMMNQPGACSPCAGDATGDGSVNVFDIQGFVECLGG